MKRNFAIALLALTTLAGAGRASAQGKAVQAAVPFEFAVGGRVLPADTYNITQATEGIVTIESLDKHVRVTTTASHGNNESANGSELIFEKYGNRYFLHEVLCPTVASMNVSIPASKEEKRVQVQEAKFGGEPVVVLLASR